MRCDSSTPSGHERAILIADGFVDHNVDAGAQHLQQVLLDRGSRVQLRGDRHTEHIGRGRSERIDLRPDNAGSRALQRPGQQREQTRPIHGPNFEDQLGRRGGVELQDAGRSGRTSHGHPGLHVPGPSGYQAGGIAVPLLQHAQHVDVAVEGTDKLLTHQLRRGRGPKQW